MSRFYDTATNGRGRLHKTEAAGTTQTTFTAYDAMGRPTQYEQKFWTGAAWGQAFAVGQSYNKAGGVISQTYPSGHTVGYNYDAAGRVSDNAGAAAFSGNLGDGIQRTYANEVRYDEMGGRYQSSL